MLTKSEFKKKPVDFRIGAIVADGMWWDIDKWMVSASVTRDELMEWIDDHMKSGDLTQAETGSRSYRMGLDAMKRWHRDQGIVLGEQLVDFIFAPRIWDGMTETEGFLKAPIREIGVLTFSCPPRVAREVIAALRGVARVREDDPGVYRAYGLSAQYIREIVVRVIESNGYEVKGGSASQGGIFVRARASAKRRELVDFSPEFLDGFTTFYAKFARTLLQKFNSTISIYLPEADEQNSQIVYWVLSATEKYNEASSVPFSGYLNAVLSRWPFDLPTEFLGKELSDFQRQKAKAIKALNKKNSDSAPNPDTRYTHEEISREMGIGLVAFSGLEEKHRVWIKTKNATTLTWDESSDERMSRTFSESTITGSTDIVLLSRMSSAVVGAALKTGMYRDASKVVSQMDVSVIDKSTLDALSPEFVQEFRKILEGSQECPEN